MRWEKVPGFDYYEVSDTGLIRNVHHRIICRNGVIKTVPEHILKPCIARNGYLMISLWKGNKPRYLYMHRLIAKLFIPNPDGFPVVNHRNGIKTDNSLGNLEWTTYSGNNTHAYRTGLKTKSKKLGANEVETIRASNKTGRELSREFGVCEATISAVKNHKNAYCDEMEEQK